MPGRLIPYSNLPDEAVRTILWGFACGAPKADIAAAAGISAKAAQSVILALRRRLLEPAFYRWNGPGDLFITRDVPYRDIVDRAVFGVIGACYFNKRCVSNYRQERRASRVCRGCPLTALFEDRPTLERTAAFVDVIHAFYAHLGIGGERRDDRTMTARLRWHHTMIVRRAVEVSRKTPENTPDFNDARPRTARTLYETLLASLLRDPLRRG